MKTYEQFITEAAVATRKKPTRKEKAEFADKFNQVLHSKVASNLRHGNRDWRLTGHNPGTRYGTSKAVEAMKEKVFGKRRKGTSDLLFIHKHHGIITHPAVGDTTHHDVRHSSHWTRKGVTVDPKISAKVNDGGPDNIVGAGRIEHHEGGGGIISYNHEGLSRVHSSAIRTIARAYPKYKIHDGQGNLLESLYKRETKDGWQHSRALGRRRWTKGSHSVERQGKRGWTVYDWHNNRELHVAKTAREAKGWSDLNRKEGTKQETINIRLPMG